MKVRSCLVRGSEFEVGNAELSCSRGKVRKRNVSNPELSNSELTDSELTSGSVPLATPEQAAENLRNPWILLKVEALGELRPEAALKPEQLIDEGRMPRERSRCSCFRITT